MGDRVLMQMVKREDDKITDFGPVLYLHWGGDREKDIVAALKKQMVGRSGDLAYSSARLVQCGIGGDEGNRSVGIWNATAPLKANDSHGDAGCVLIDCDTFAAECFGGYLISG